MLALTFLPLVILPQGLAILKHRFGICVYSEPMLGCSVIGVGLPENSLRSQSLCDFQWSTGLLLAAAELHFISHSAKVWWWWGLYRWNLDSHPHQLPTSKKLTQLPEYCTLICHVFSFCLLKAVNFLLCACFGFSSTSMKPSKCPCRISLPTGMIGFKPKGKELELDIASQSVGGSSLAGALFFSQGRAW